MKGTALIRTLSHYVICATSDVFAGLAYSINDDDYLKTPNLSLKSPAFVVPS